MGSIQESVPSADMTRQPWEVTVALKRQAQQDAISAFRAKNLNGIENIVDDTGLTDENDAAILATRLTSSNITAENVALAYIASLTEVCFEDALRHARGLDRYRADHGTAIGPLHGIPMTLKDQFNVRGFDSTLGYVGRAGSPASADATLVQMLQSLGAVILAKTNLPQSIMWCETDNPLWGLTTNLVDARYTPGGSTGGEAALLAQHGSSIGWGTDIGGSIRIPAHMMGLYGLKPSSARLPYGGAAVSTEGQEHVPSSVGPLARSLSSIRLAMQALVEARPWTLDPRCVPMPWDTATYEATLAQKLTVAVLWDDGTVRPHPPLIRVLQETVARLRAAGHDVFDWGDFAGLHADIVAVQDAFYKADGGEDIRRDVAAGGEPMIPHVARLTDCGPGLSVYEYWQLNRCKWALQQAYLDKWNATRSPTTGRTADVLLLPPMPHTAVPHGSCRYVGYTKVWNVLDYTALVVPAGHVVEADIHEKWAHTPRNDTDAYNAQLWDEHKADMARLGLPVGVQIVGQRLQEEKVLAAGRVIDDLLQGR